MDERQVADRSSPRHPLLRFRRASQAVHATQALDEVLSCIISELHSALDVEAASVALLDKRSGEFILHAAGPVAEKITGLRLPSGLGIIGWVIENGQSAIANDVSTDDRFWPDIDGYSGFQTRSALCAPLLSGFKVVGALEVLNKRQGEFTTEDMIFLEAFGAVAASAIESARHFRREQQRRREADVLHRAWEALTTAHSLEELLEVVLDQLGQLIEYRSASVLLVTEDGGLKLGASRGIESPDEAAKLVSKLGLDTKVQTMLETHQPMHIADTRSDARWQHFPGLSYVRCWIGAPLLINEQLIGTLNVDHDQPGFYDIHHVHLVTDLARQAAVAIENSQLYAVTHEATLQLAERDRRMVTLYETSRALLSGLGLDPDALHTLVSCITDLVGARYGILNILAQDSQAPLFIAVGPDSIDGTDVDWAGLGHSVLGVLSSEREVIRSNELSGIMGTGRPVPPALLDSFLGVAIHARGRLLGHLLLAGGISDRRFSQEDEALALALAANLATAIENIALYHKTQQRLRELTALFEISRTVTRMTESGDVFTHLAKQVARLIDAERCAIFVFKDGMLECQPPGYGLSPDIIPQLSFPIKQDDPLYAIIHASEPLISNDVMREPELATYRPLLAQLQVHRLLSSRIVVDDPQIGLLVAADKRGGEEFGKQDRYLVSVFSHQVSNVLQRALLQSRQREQAHIQSALLEVSEVISSLAGLDELLQTVAEITRRLVGCDHCFIASWEERYTAFVPRAQSGLAPPLNELLSQIRLRPVDAPFIDRATETRKPVLLTRQDIREAVPPWAKELLGLEKSLIVPLVAQEQVVGLIATAYSEKIPLPGKREIALVTGIARQTAIAIENANLYQDLQLHSARLERALRDLKELDERKTQFVQNVSHELRTPFTLIKGYLEMLMEEELGALSDRQKGGLAVIAEKIDALGKLILDIVTVQSIDATSLELQEFDLAYLLQTIQAGARADTFRGQLQYDLPADLPRVKADTNLVERALNHLLENAVKFSPEGGVIILRAIPEGDMMRIEVEDQGIGIPEAALSNVFDPFYQVDGSTTRRFGGTGLGLAIVKRIVTAHGGRVGVRSAQGRGSVFYCTLPLASPPDVIA